MRRTHTDDMSSQTQELLADAAKHKMSPETYRQPAYQKQDTDPRSTVRKVTDAVTDLVKPGYVKEEEAEVREANSKAAARAQKQGENDELNEIKEEVFGGGGLSV